VSGGEGAGTGALVVSRGEGATRAESGGGGVVREESVPIEGKAAAESAAVRRVTGSR